MHTALHVAEVVHARHDFLARIAALVERHRAERIEIQHLRDEAVDERRSDGGQPQSNLGQRGRGRGHCGFERCDCGARAQHLPVAGADA